MLSGLARPVTPPRAFERLSCRASLGRSLMSGDWQELKLSAVLAHEAEQLADILAVPAAITFTHQPVSRSPSGPLRAPWGPATHGARMRSCDPWRCARHTGGLQEYWQGLATHGGWIARFIGMETGSAGKSFPLAGVEVASASSDPARFRSGSMVCLFVFVFI